MCDGNVKGRFAAVARHVGLWLCACVAFSASRLEAQSATVGEGLRVRVHAPALMKSPAIGSITSGAPGFVGVVVGDGAARVDVPMSNVTRVDVSVGRSRARGALIGAGVFGIAGLVAGAAIGTASDDTNEGLVAFALGVSGLATGLTLGGIGGAIWGPERWTAAPMFPLSAPLSVSARARVTILEGATVRVTSSTLNRVKVKASASDSGGFHATYGDTSSRVEWIDVKRIDVRGGRNRQRGAAYGAIAGALLTIIPGMIDSRPTGLSGSESATIFVSNTVIGGLVGALLAPRGWQPLPIPVAAGEG